jgi:hypothetical protein
MSKIKILEDDGILKMQEWAKTRFDEYITQRESIDEAYEVSDFFYKGGTARGTYDRERRQWVPRIAEGKANVGSGLWHRQVNTLAGILGGVLMSGRDLFQYRDKHVRGNDEQSGAYTADAMNALAKAIQKIDKFEQRIPEFCTAIFKQSNIFAHIAMKRTERDVTVGEDIEEDTGEVDEYGTPILKIRKRFRKKSKRTEFPTITFPYPRNIYADNFISSMEDQDCVFMLTLTNRQRLLSEGKWLDQEKLAQTPDDDLKWDGMFGKAGKDSDAQNAHRDELPANEHVILRWDMYAYIPVKNGNWFDPAEEGSDTMEDVEMRLVWGVFAGNSVDDAVCLKLVDDFSPNGRIPLKELRASPDDSDMLYHTFTIEPIRSMYAADCALMNSACDNMALINDPPLLIRTHGHRVKDFTFKSGQKWFIETDGAIQRMDVRDTTQNTVQLRNQIREDAKLAMATDDARTGEYAGARTSAFEVQQVTGSTDTTIALKNAYILGQLLPWMAENYLEYCREFMEPEMIRSIIGEHINARVPGEYIGDYDVVVDILGQYEDDRAREQGIDRLMQIIGSNPAFLESNTHRVDLGELVRMYIEHKKLPVGRIIGPPNTADSEANARRRVQAMLMTGTYIPPEQGENHKVHERVVRNERARWRGLEDVNDPRAQNIPLLEQYLQDLKQMQQQQAMPQGGGGGPEMPGAEQGPGMDIAGEMGAMMGGM